jgi:hypothetical protein
MFSKSNMPSKLSREVLDTITMTLEQQLIYLFRNMCGWSKGQGYCGLGM